MNAWLLNSIAGHALRYTITIYFNIPFNEIYRKVKSINNNIIETKDGKKYEVTLKEIE